MKLLQYAENNGIDSIFTHTLIEMITNSYKELASNSASNVQF